MPRKKTLVQKINAVRRKVDYVKKDKKVDGKYMVVTHDAVTAMVRQALIDNSLVITPPSVKTERTVDTGMVTGNGAPVIRYEAVFTIVLTDGEQEMSADIPAHANDYGDKAPGKAMSYAVKAFMLKMFNIETGEDEEGRIAMADQGRAIETQEYARLQGLIGDIKDKGEFDEGEYIEYLKNRGLVGDKLTDITQGIYPIALAALQKKLAVLNKEANNG